MTEDDGLSLEARYSLALGAIPRVLDGPPNALARMYDEYVSARDWEGALGIMVKPWRLYRLREWWRAGTITLDELREVLPGTWTGSEPDSELRWWPLFRDAGYCGNVLPQGDPLRVYRGGQPGDSLGMAWSLERDVARFFALRLPAGQGSGGIPMRSGEVITGDVPRAKVRAYITDREEAEVIVHPRSVRVIGRELVEAA